MDIILYTDESSYFSVETRRWLDERGVSYRLKNVADKQMEKELFEISEQYGVPVVVVGNEVVVGFNEKRMEELLG